MDQTEVRLAPSVDRYAGRSPESPAPVVRLPESFRGRLLLRLPDRVEVSPTGVCVADAIVPAVIGRIRVSVVPDHDVGHL